MAARFDAIIIGTGQAGPPLADRLTDAGWRCAIVERQRFGGTCVNCGAHMARRAADFVVQVGGPVQVDMAAVRRRKDETAGHSNESITSYVKDMKNAQVFEGHAVFEGDRRVRVGNETLEADRIFINVGARPMVRRSRGSTGCPTSPTRACSISRSCPST
jgi:pyruvate/2-oxoglutarate dehydrogenase complex dihydrolipoamide dehydrogenase (E3) component